MMGFCFPQLLFILLYLFSSPANLSAPAIKKEASLMTPFAPGNKINGASIVGSSSPMDESEFNRLDSLHVNYVCLLPFAFVEEGKPKVYYNTGFQWWGERPEGIASCIRMAHAHGMQVMVKPQLWVSHGKFTGELTFKSEAEWKQFEESYSSYLFQLLEVADSLHAEYFCLGTELNYFVRARSSYWSLLIDAARKRYSGQLTYAENWDCYEDFPYWNKVDAIGVNAYFPLSDSSTPPVEELLNKWDPHFQKMKSLATKTGKQILFTEYGYRSIDYAAQRPWESYTDGIMNLQAQQNGYEALFEKFWQEPWMAGGFFWKWFDAHTDADIPVNLDFTPQEKPAIKVIQQWYSKHQ
ncbi:MAG: hypothetical protein WBB36_10010 [Chitinophagales bacterium]